MSGAALPLFLTSLRVFLAPMVVGLALLHPWRAGFAVCLVVAFLSDVFDGIVARRLGVATPGLRRFDSIADSVFYAAATFAVYCVHPDAILQRLAPLGLLAALECARYAFDFAKFRRETSYHMWSSKLWGVVLFAAFFSLLALGVDGPLVDAAVYVGIAADCEGLAISLLLVRWRTDVPTILHALRLRRAELRR